MASFLSPGNQRSKRHLVTIVKILNPVTFMVKECPNDNMSESAQDFIKLESSVLSTVDAFDIETTENVLPSKGTYVIVKPRSGVIWSRGRVDNLLETSKSLLANVYLIDEGITVSVPLKYLRYPPSKMFEVPFQAFEFLLFELKPLSLSFNEDMMLGRMPSDRWDPSTEVFLRNFLAGKSTVEIEVQKRDSEGRFHGKMFSPIDGEVCLNEELVLNGYAHSLKNQYRSSIPKSHIVELKSNSGSDSGVQVEEKSPTVAVSNEEFKAQKLDDTPEFGLQQLGIGSCVSSPASIDSISLQQTGIGRGTSRRRRNLHQDFSLLQPTICKTSSAKNVSPQISPISIPDRPAIRGLGRGILNYAMQEKYNNLNRRNKNLNPEGKKGEIDKEDNKNMNNLRKVKGLNKSFETTQKDELSCDTENSSRSSSLLSEFNESVEGSSRSNSRMSQLLEYAKVIGSGNKADQQQFNSASPLNTPDAATAQTKGHFNRQKLLEIGKKYISNKEISSQPIMSSDKAFEGTEVENVNGTNRNKQSQIEDEFAARSTLTGIESYKKYLRLRKKCDEAKLKSIEVENEKAQVFCPEWERYMKYAKIKEKTSPKDDEARMMPLDKDLNAVLKPLPPKFCRNVTIESLAKTQSVCSSPEKNNFISSEKNTFTSPEKTTVTLPEKTTVTLPEKTTVTLPEKTTVTLPNKTTVTLPEKKTVTSQEKTIVTSQEKTIVTSQEKTPITSPKKTRFTSPEKTTITSPEKTTITSPNNIGSGILYRIKSEGVLSFLREKSSNENTYTLCQTPEARRNFLLLKEDLCRFDIKNVICLGNQIPSPSMQINDYYFEERINKALKACKITNPRVLQSYMWPVMLRGRNCVAIGLKNAGKTLGYAVPILNDLSQEGKYEDLPPGPGPLAIVLCSNWMICQKVQEDFDKCNQFSRRFNILTIHGGDNIEKKMMEFLRGYEVLVTTPSVILKLMKNEMNINIIERCCHLILDDADHVIEIFHNEILEFLPEFRKVFICRGKNTSSPNQFVVSSSAWTKGVKSFVRMIANPILLFSNFLEAAIQAEIPFYVDICKQYQEVSVVADLLGKNVKCNIVICCTTSEYVRNLAAILKSHSFHFLIAHEEMNKPDLENIKQQWKASTDCSNHPILIVSDVILPLIEISNAECLIHYNLPDLSKLQFSNRFSCLRDVISFWHNIPQNTPEMVVQARLRECVNYIVMNEKNSHQSYELMKIMQRMNCPIPEGLSKLAQMELMTRQLCNNLLSFGKCAMKEICRQRHTFHSSIDQPNEGIPHWGNVELLITYVINAGLYYGNILKYKDPNSGQEITQQREQFLHLNLNLSYYFEGNKVKEMMTEPKVKDICAFRGVGGAYFRVKIKEVFPTKSGFTRKVTIFSIDEGWTRTVELESIFQLPKEFADFPPQAVQIRLCKVKPIDGSDIWTNQASTFANDLVKDKQLRGNVVLSFNNCIFVTNLGPNSLCSVANSTLISVVSNLKSANFVVSNPTHIGSLSKLCKGIIFWTFPPPEPSKVNLSSLVTYESFQHNVSKAVFLTSIQSPSLFYVVPVENYYNLLDLNDKINVLLVEGKLRKIENLTKNALVLGPYILEQRWYRARITDVIQNDQTIVRLFFPDFGDECSAVENDIYEISPDLLEILPFQAVECSLTGVCPAHGGWSENAIESFTNFTREDDDDSLYRKFTLEALQTSPAVNSNTNHYCVSLHFGNGLSLAEELIKEGLAEDVNKPEVEATSPTENYTDSACNDSADEELNRLENEYYNNFAMLLNGFNTKSIEEFRGYKVSASRGPQLRALKNQPDKLQTCMKETVKPKLKSPVKEIKSVPKDFYPMPTLLVCKDIPRSQPKTTWFQTDEFVIIHFELICTEYFAHIGANFLQFRTIRGNKFYDFKEELYANIIPQDCTSIQLPLYAKFCLKKAEKVHWLKLVKSDEKKPHISLNFDHIDDDDDNSVPQKPLKTKFHTYVRPYDSESSSEDDLFIEEVED